MKKFLCYDTNDAASGKIEVDNRGMLKPNSTVPSTNGTPYQQLVTDGDGNTQWEDRLAYVATEEQVIFSQDNIAFTEDKETGLYRANFEITTAISTGENYSVNFDGKTYISTAVIFMDAILIGNASLIEAGDDTGEPFVMFYYPDGSTVDIGTVLTSTTHTVSISRVVETVHKLPQAYLPEKTTVYVSSGDEYMYFDSERTRQLSAEDFISAVNSGGIDFIKLPISSVEVHLQMINYGINETSGTVIALIAEVSSNGSTIDILSRSATSASIIS